jgi:CheY-like chemotaxis protein
MSPETVAHIFDPYFTTKEMGKGTGLGLAVVHGIIETYKGFIEVESEPGHGSTFRIFIPALEKDISIPEKSKQPESLPFGTERILIVDDEPLLVRINQRLLENYGYTVTGVTDSREALAKVQADPKQFDLIVSDQTMPGLTGSELAKAVLKIAPFMPIIICTGHSAVTSADDAYAMGIKRYLYKPVEGDTLAATIRMVLDEQERNQER